MHTSCRKTFGSNGIDVAHLVGTLAKNFNPKANLVGYTTKQTWNGVNLSAVDVLCIYGRASVESNRLHALIDGWAHGQGVFSGHRARGVVLPRSRPVKGPYRWALVSMMPRRLFSKVAASEGSMKQDMINIAA